MPRDGMAGPRGADGSGVWGLAATAWALTGVGLLFSTAILRLGRRGIETLQAGLEPGEWAVLVLLTLVFMVGEGWGALQRKWVPRLVDRARDVRETGSKAHRVLAPFYGMSLIGASRAGLLRAWGGTAGIVAAVMVVRSLPDPWRGITDLSVTAALLWGVVALLLEGRRAFE